MNKKLISESFSAYQYAVKKKINPKDITTWDVEYKKRMQKLAGILHEMGDEVKNIKSK